MNDKETTLSVETGQTTAVCPILGRETKVRSTPFHRGEWLVVQCEETGFVFLQNPPGYAQLESEFAWEKTVPDERLRRTTEEPVFSVVSSAVKATKKKLFPKRNKMVSLAMKVTPLPKNRPIQILDIGCGSGGLLVKTANELKRRGYDAVTTGVEVSAELAKSASRRLAEFNGSLIQNNAVDGLAGWQPETVDLMLMSSFLEHERDPLGLLRCLRRIVTMEGAIVLKVPNYNCFNRYVRGRRWCGFRYPDHVNYFTPQTLKRLAAEAGFRVSRQRIDDKAPFSDNMYAVLKIA